MNIRVGNGYDVHALAPGLPLILGGISIPYEYGCVAHSDGDVVIHSLCDALLGALALGDIGKHFPDTDPAYKGIDSKILLDKVTKLISSYEYGLLNADITILAQKPKLLPYVDQMRQTLASITGVDISAISIKATTTEKLGFVGRKEGIAVYAVVLLSKE
mgnify:FL=1